MGGEADLVDEQVSGVGGPVWGLGVVAPGGVEVVGDVVGPSAMSRSSAMSASWPALIAVIACGAVEHVVAPTRPTVGGDGGRYLESVGRVGYSSVFPGYVGYTMPSPWSCIMHASMQS